MSREVREAKKNAPKASSNMLFFIRELQIARLAILFRLYDSEGAVLNRIKISRKIRETERICYVINKELRKRGLVK